MWATLFVAECVPFLTALLLMLSIASCELIGLFFGLGPLQLIEAALPDFDADIELSAGWEQVAAWLFIGKLPLLVTTVLFLTLYGLIGCGIQLLAMSLFGSPLPTAAAALTVLCLTLLPFRVLVESIACWIPNSESEAPSRRDLTGQSGSVIRGKGRRGHPCEARIGSLYLMVEPLGEEELKEGDAVTIQETSGTHYYVTKTHKQKEIRQ